MHWARLTLLAWLGFAGIAYAQVSVPSGEGEPVTESEGATEGEVSVFDALPENQTEVPPEAPVAEPTPPAEKPAAQPPAETPAAPADKTAPAPPSEKAATGTAMEELKKAAESAPEAPDAAAAEDKDSLRYDTVLLQGLNKVTARTSQLELPLGTAVRFGNLELVARACWQSPPEARPENGALLDIWELKPGETPQQIFKGWMFSPTPALSALEHPVYDVTVQACKHRTVKPGSE